MAKVTFQCAYCKNFFKRYPKPVYKKRFCNKRCSSRGQVGSHPSQATRRKLRISHLGNKSALGKHWRVSEEGRKHMSEGQLRLVALGRRSSRRR